MRRTRFTGFVLKDTPYRCDGILESPIKPSFCNDSPQLLLTLYADTIVVIDLGVV